MLKWCVCYADCNDNQLCGSVLSLCTHQPLKRCCSTQGAAPLSGVMNVHTACMQAAVKSHSMLHTACAVHCITSIKCSAAPDTFQPCKRPCAGKMCALLVRSILHATGDAKVHPHRAEVALMLSLVALGACYTHLPPLVSSYLQELCSAALRSVIDDDSAQISFVPFPRVVSISTDLAARGCMDRGRQAHQAGCTLCHAYKGSQDGPAAHLLL